MVKHDGCDVRKKLQKKNVKEKLIKFSIRQNDCE